MKKLLKKKRSFLFYGGVSTAVAACVLLFFLFTACPTPDSPEVSGTPQETPKPAAPAGDAKILIDNSGAEGATNYLIQLNGPDAENNPDDRESSSTEELYTDLSEGHWETTITVYNSEGEVCCTAIVGFYVDPDREVIVNVTLNCNCPTSDPTPTPPSDPTPTICILSTAPSGISASAGSVCTGGSVTLYVNGGSLGDGAAWKWYKGSCGGTYIGSGSYITVSPTGQTAYFVRAEGTCNVTGCASKTIGYTELNTNPAWSSAETLTAIDGDCHDGGGAIRCYDGPSVSGTGSKWYKIWVNEGSSWLSDVRIWARLESPANVDYDLYLFLDTGNGLEPIDISQNGFGQGTTDTVTGFIPDGLFTAENRQYYILVTYAATSGGNTCANWHLDIWGGCPDGI